nr:hypothetical protein [Sorangium cellulosum]
MSGGFAMASAKPVLRITATSAAGVPTSSMMHALPFVCFASHASREQPAATDAEPRMARDILRDTWL